MTELIAFVAIKRTDIKSSMSGCVMELISPMFLVRTFDASGDAYELAHCINVVHMSTGCVEFVLDASRDTIRPIKELLKFLAPSVKILYVSSTT